MRRSRLVLVPVGAILPGMVLAACAAAPDPARPGPDDASAVAVTLIEVRAAAERAVACMRSGGVEARYAEDLRHDGVPLPGWRARPPARAESPDDAVVEACDDREFAEVSRAYQTQGGLERVTVHLSQGSAGALP